jgi:hypothetical protein
MDRRPAARVLSFLAWTEESLEGLIQEHTKNFNVISIKKEYHRYDLICPMRAKVLVRKR